MNTIKQRLFTNWHLMRVVRLGLGLWLLVWAIQTKDWSIGAVSAFFVLMALTGTGCCGPQGCYNPGINNTTKLPETGRETEYEEIK